MSFDPHQQEGIRPGETSPYANKPLAPKPTPPANDFPPPQPGTPLSNNIATAGQVSRPARRTERLSGTPSRIIAATGGIAVFYVIEMVMGFFGSGVHFAAINGSGALGIGFSVVVVAVAALNLVLDFDFIEQGVRMGAPKYMEWYGAFGIMVTLIWLYLEILRLLSKMRSRN